MEAAVEELLMTTRFIAVLQVQVFKDDFLKMVAKKGEKDQEWKEIQEKVYQGQILLSPYTTKGQKLYFKNQLTIVDDEDSRTQILESEHNSKVAGHFSIDKTVELISRNFYWPKMTKYISNYVWSCNECQYNKLARHTKYRLLQLLELPFTLWINVSMNFIIHLPESDGYSQVLVVVDKVTKMVHFIGLKEEATTKDMTKVFLFNVWKLHVLPREIVLDSDA